MVLQWVNFQGVGIRSLKKGPREGLLSYPLPKGDATAWRWLVRYILPRPHDEHGVGWRNRKLGDSRIHIGHRNDRRIGLRGERTATLPFLIRNTFRGLF